MSAAKKRKESSQPELPIEGAPPAPVAARPARKSAGGNGNGAAHVLAEEFTAGATHPTV